MDEESMAQPSMDLRGALDLARTLGPFSAVARERGPGWQPISLLLADTTAVAARIQVTRGALASRAGTDPGGVDERVAASVMQLGLAARLTAPALATAVLGGWVADLEPSRLWWLAGSSDPVPLALAEPQGTQGTDLDELAAAFHSLVTRQVIGPLIAAVVEAVPMSEAVLWGNVWSGLAGGLAPVAAARPDLAERARSIVIAVLDDPAVQYRGGFTRAGRYRRATCCLLYRIPGGGLCGDCVLPASPSASGA
jgi:hypothetical protein